MILAVEDLESIEATLELLADPDAQARVSQTEADIADGDVFNLDDIKGDLLQRSRDRR